MKAPYLLPFVLALLAWESPGSSSPAPAGAALAAGSRGQLQWLELHASADVQAGQFFLASVSSHSRCGSDWSIAGRQAPTWMRPTGPPPAYETTVSTLELVRTS